MKDGSWHACCLRARCAGKMSRSEKRGGGCVVLEVSSLPEDMLCLKASERGLIFQTTVSV